MTPADLDRMEEALERYGSSEGIIEASHWIAIIARDGKAIIARQRQLEAAVENLRCMFAMEECDANAELDMNDDVHSKVNVSVVLRKLRSALKDGEAARLAGLKDGRYERDDALARAERAEAERDALRNKVMAVSLALDDQNPDLSWHRREQAIRRAVDGKMLKAEKDAVRQAITAEKQEAEGGR